MTASPDAWGPYPPIEWPRPYMKKKVFSNLLFHTSLCLIPFTAYSAYSAYSAASSEYTGKDQYDHYDNNNYPPYPVKAAAEKASFFVRHIFHPLSMYFK